MVSIENIIDNYDHPMKNARKISSFEEYDDEEDIKEEIEEIKSISHEEIEAFKDWKNDVAPRKKGENKFADAEHMHLTPNVTPPIHITLYPGHDGKMIEAFWEGSLHDTENGAGEISETRKAPVCHDPEIMAKQMPGKGRGYTKNGTEMGKPKCPICKVTVSDFGMCPVCERQVTRRFNNNGTIVTVFNDGPKPVRDQYVAPEMIEGYIKIKEGETIRKVSVGLFKRESEWLKDEPIGKFNFCGTVNKKSDGRSPRGEIPDAKDPDRMSKFRHTPSFKLDYNVKIVQDEGKPRYGLNDIPIKKVKAELNECECGCKVTMNEMRRGDKLCPKCGMVLGRVVFHLNPMEEED